MLVRHCLSAASASASASFERKIAAAESILVSILSWLPRMAVRRAANDPASNIMTPETESGLRNRPADRNS